MKIIRIEREVSCKVYIGGYETVEPKVRIVGELEAGDDVAEAAQLVSIAAQEQWVLALEQDVALSMKRRQASGTVWTDDKSTELLTQGIPAMKK